MAYKILIKKSKLVISPPLVGTDIDKMLRQFYQYQGIAYVDQDNSWILMALDYSKYLEYCEKNYMDEALLSNNYDEIYEFIMKAYYKYQSHGYIEEQTDDDFCFSLYEWIDDDSDVYEIEFEEIDEDIYDDFFY